MKKSTRSAFSLVELMIVVALIADLAAVALPAFVRSRNLAQDTKFITDLRTASGAFEVYGFENNKYPASTGPGIIPSGMANYLKGFPWMSANSIGGEWLWATGYQSTTAAVVVQFPSAIDDVRMTDIDLRFDNGILATGAFRQGDPTHYFYIVEP